MATIVGGRLKFLYGHLNQERRYRAMVIRHSNEFTSVTLIINFFINATFQTLIN